MAFDDFIANFSNEELGQLATRINQNEISADREAALRELLEDVPMRDRQDAWEEKPSIVDVLVALGLEFDFPNGDMPVEPEPITDEEADENGVEIAEEPSEEPFEPGDLQPGRQPRAEGRPDPRFGRANLVDRFPSPHFRDEFVRLETARRNFMDEQDREMEPREFFEQFATQVLGQHFALTLEEFVEAEQSPSSTGQGF